MKTLRNLILLSRIGMLPLSLSVPIIGALSLRQSIAPLDFIALAGIGITAHFFGFILNDLMDYTLDKHSPFRQRSPLVRGDVKHWQAWLFIMLQVPIAILLYAGVLNGHPLGLLWLGLSVSLSIVYNLFSKWRWLPRILAELALASSVVLLALSGAWIYQQTLPIDAGLYCLTLGLILLLVNSVPSGLKDIQFDNMFGARSFVLSTQTAVSQDGELVLSPFLKRYMVGLQGIVTLLLIGLATQYPLDLFAWMVLIGLQLYSGLHTLRLLRLRHVDEFPDAVLLLGGYYNYLALVIIVWAYLPALVQFMLAIVLVLLLTIPFRRAWSMYRQRNKTILSP